MATLFQRMRDQSGVGLIDIMVATGIAGLLTFVLMSVVPSSRTIARRSNEQTSVLVARQRLFEAISHPENWRLTVINNAATAGSAMACLSSHTACAAPTTGFLVWTIGGLWYSGNDATAGFDYGGERCTGAPSRTCPIRAAITWTATCATCNPSLILVNVAFSYYDPKFGTRNADWANFSLYKNVWDQPCTTTDGEQVATGESTYLYLNTTAPCQGSYRSCSNGTWSGGSATHLYKNCP